jgi:cytochrome P450
MLILAVDEEDGSSMTNEQLRDEAMTIFLAGHETTANALAWTFYLLGENPQIAAKVTEELDRVLGGRLPTLADLKALPYLAMVFKETLRLYPPAPGLARQPIEDVELGGHRIPVDATVSVSIWALHRNPRLWADPLKFDPERFNATNEPLIPKYAYLPFGGGPRVCIGNMFAEMEALLVLATILSRYTLETAPNHPVKPQQTVTLRPKHGMKMILHTRKVTTPDHWVAAQPALTTPV